MAFYRCAACGGVSRVTSTGPDAPACPRCRSALDVSGAPQRIDSAALVSVILSSPAPVLVGFAAPGERSCASLDDLASARAGEVVCLQVDTASEPAAAEAYAVAELPTLLLFSGGTEVGRVPARLPPRDIARWMAIAGNA
jgi:thioredoxin-like negative regulator of GroEL